MSKRERQTEQETVTSKDVSIVDSEGQTTELIVMHPEHLKPAALVGVRNELKFSKEALAMLPEEFQGANLETLDTTLPPTVKWVKPGEWVAGIFEGFEENVGPNNSDLYHFDAKGKKFSIWETTTLDRIFRGVYNKETKTYSNPQVQPGEMLLITYIGDIPTDMNPCKMFDIKRAGVKKA